MKKASLFVLRYMALLSRGLLCVFIRNEKGYEKVRKDFDLMFPERTPEEEREIEESIPPNMRWWAAEEREPLVAETGLICKTCELQIGSDTIKECPNCHVIMHAKCYIQPYGSYQTPDCEACYQRCYAR